MDAPDVGPVFTACGAPIPLDGIPRGALCGDIDEVGTMRSCARCFTLAERVVERYPDVQPPLRIVFPDRN